MHENTLICSLLEACFYIKLRGTSTDTGTLWYRHGVTANFEILAHRLGVDMENFIYKHCYTCLNTYAIYIYNMMHYMDKANLKDLGYQYIVSTILIKYTCMSVSLFKASDM